MNEIVEKHHLHSGTDFTKFAFYSTSKSRNLPAVSVVNTVIGILPENEAQKWVAKMEGLLP